jgi:hypothetical protein
MLNRYDWEKVVSKLPQMDEAYMLGRGYDPVSELMRAIILRTIEDLRAGGELRVEALQYIYNQFEDNNEDDEEYIFSFDAICQTLGMNPERARDHIIRAAVHGERRISTRRRAA